MDKIWGFRGKSFLRWHEHPAHDCHSVHTVHTVYQGSAFAPPAAEFFEAA